MCLDKSISSGLHWNSDDENYLDDESLQFQNMEYKSWKSIPMAELLNESATFVPPQMSVAEAEVHRADAESETELHQTFLVEVEVHRADTGSDSD